MTRIVCMLLTYSGAYRNSGTLLIVYHKRETHHISDIRTKPHQRRGLFQSYISHYNCAQYVLLRSEVCDGTRFMFRKATRSHAPQPGGTSQCILELAEQRRRLRFTKRKIPQKLHLFKCTIESICRIIRTCTNLPDILGGEVHTATCRFLPQVYRLRREHSFKIAIVRHHWYGKQLQLLLINRDLSDPPFSSAGWRIPTGTCACVSIPKGSMHFETFQLPTSFALNSRAHV